MSGWSISAPATAVADLLLFITAGPITKLFAWGEGDNGGHVL
jgi:hypothetical protein